MKVDAESVLMVAVVLLFLYYLMGRCNRVEGMLSPTTEKCDLLWWDYMDGRPALPGNKYDCKAQDCIKKLMADPSCSKWESEVVDNCKGVCQDTVSV